MKNITYETLGKSWYEENPEANYRTYIKERDKNNPFFFGGGLTVRILGMNNIYKFIFKLRVNELFNNKNDFHNYFKAYYKPGIFGGYFNQRAVNLKRVINRTIEFPRSATAIALYAMIQDRQKHNSNLLQDPLWLNVSWILQQSEQKRRKTEGARLSNNGGRTKRVLPSSQPLDEALPNSIIEERQKQNSNLLQDPLWLNVSWILQQSEQKRRKTEGERLSYNGGRTKRVLPSAPPLEQVQLPESKAVAVAVAVAVNASWILQQSKQRRRKTEGERLSYNGGRTKRVLPSAPPLEQVQLPESKAVAVAVPVVEATPLRAH